MKHRVAVLLIFILVMIACSCAVFADESEDDKVPKTEPEQSAQDIMITVPDEETDVPSVMTTETDVPSVMATETDVPLVTSTESDVPPVTSTESEVPPLTSTESGMIEEILDPEPGADDPSQSGKEDSLIDEQPEDPSGEPENVPDDEQTNAAEISEGSQEDLREEKLSDDQDLIPKDEPEQIEEQKELTEPNAAAEEIQQPVLLRTAKTVEKAVRTILMYDCGSDLETKAAMATYNLHQILQSKFSQDDKVRFIVMTGGSNTWHLESEYLYDPETGLSPGAISSEYNQIWEAKGLDAAENPGKLVLLDRDGILGDGENAYKAAVDYTINEYGEKVYDWDKDYEWMTKPEVLQAFINYGVANFPADKYDLILWDHGSGACYGFGDDEHDPTGKFFGADNISFSEFIDALVGTELIQNGGKFDFIDFDACLMNSLEINLALADYADYYIASADKEPGYGQYYTRWLNVLGEDPDTNGFELGKIIVDDFIAFYDKEEGDGSTQEGTLAVMDLQKLADSDLAEELASLADRMTREATQVNENGEYLFYDELNSFYNAIRYAGWEYTDLRNMASLISIILHEINAEDVTGDPEVLENEYLDTAKNLITLLSDPDMIYAGATKGEVADGQFVRDSGGNVTFRPLRPTGMHLFFPDIDSPGIVDVYANELEAVMHKMGMPENDNRAEFFTKYIKALRFYAAIPFIGRAVDEMIDEGTPRDEIHADSVKDYLVTADASRWDEIVSPALDNGFGSEEEAWSWLESLIRQQAGEAVEEANVSLVTVREPEGTGYQISIGDTRQRVIDSIRKNAYLELPVLEEYVSQHPELARVLMWAGDDASIKLGSVTGTQEFDMELTHDGFLADFVRWYNNDTCIWNLDPTEAKWYALQDAQGNLLVAAAEPSRDRMLVPVTYDRDGEPIMAVLIFRDGKLSEISSWQDGHMGRSIMASDLKENLTLLPVLYINDFGDEYYLPISRTDFTITPENVDKIRLTYTDISNIPDIGDTDGDGKAFQEQIVLRDIYHYEWDLSDLVQKPSGALTSIWVASVLPAVYNGKEQAAQVVVDGVPLVEGRDYVWSKDDENDSFTDVGAHSMLMRGIGDYIKYVFRDFVINPASIEDTAISGITDKTYTGTALGQSPVITFGDMTLVEGRDYTVTYENNVETGTATMTIQGIGNFTGTVTKMFAILPVEEEPEVVPEGKPQEEAETAPSEHPEKKHWTPSADGQNPGSNEEAVRDVPKTGDLNQTILWVLLLLIASGVLAGCVLVIRTQRDGPFVHLFTSRTRLKCGFRHWTTTQKDRPSVLNNKTPR